MLPVNVNAADMAFGGDIKKLLPAYEDIPKEFKHFWDNEWCNIASTWFFEGLSDKTIFDTKEGIDEGKALRHLSAVLRSFAPKHEHKIAGVGYLMSLWFNKIEIPKTNTAGEKK